jgi:ParB-like chromosome segregation protein Spo0J
VTPRQLQQLEEKNKNTRMTETIGGYTIHPAALLFPDLTPDRYEELKTSIKAHGQQMPVVVQGKTLLDGRHRLRACADLGIEPIIKEHDGKVSALEWIYALNLQRRDLTDDQRAVLVLKMQEQMVEESRAKQIEAGKRGAEGGRGHKKNPSPGIRRRDYRAEHARSSTGRAAAAVGVSRYQVEQAAKVKKHSPELLEQVRNGAITLAKAAETVTAAAAPERTREPAPAGAQSQFSKCYLRRKHELIVHIHDTMFKFHDEREDLYAAVISEANLFKPKRLVEPEASEHRVAELVS